ncbi:hypothetical protein CDEST_07894 [Colletotrichum destructivum]|uniref:Secreted protein n=1 Tax=Colletotrichum destructivum TaxID=34406 RepID=A0AAX4IHR6_9PEZI|nr:hypothetical protein CDEST_07894 [Colletotrichum destructivum]
MPILVLLAMDTAMAFSPGDTRTGVAQRRRRRRRREKQETRPGLVSPARPLARSTPFPLLISSHERQASSVVTRLIEKKRASLGSVGVCMCLFLHVPGR